MMAQVTKVLLWGFCLWCFWWLTVGASLSFPNVEDLSLAALPRDQGLLASVRTVMLSYDGRYFTNLLHGINPLAWDMPAGYVLMPLVGMAGMVTSLMFLLRAIGAGKHWRNRLLAALLFLCVHFALSPSLPHDLYVMVSSFVYMWPWTFFFLWMGSYVRFYRAGSAQWLLLCMVALGCGIGMNEMFLPLHAIAVSIVCFHAMMMRGRASAKTILPVAIVAFFAALLFVTSPGISNRLASDSQGFAADHLLRMMQLCATDLADNLWHWAMGNSFIIPSSMAVAMLMRGSVGGKRWNKWASVLLLLVAPLVLYLMALGFYLPVGNEQVYPSRIYTSILYGVQLWVIGLLLCIGSLVRFSETIRKVTNLLAAVVLGATLLIADSNYATLGQEYREGILTEYHNQMKQRYEVLNTAAKSSDIWKQAVIRPLTATPTTILLYSDVGNNRSPDYWNRAYEMYFRLDEVMLEGDTLTKCNILFP